jgi:hypothetical protein
MRWRQSSSSWSRSASLSSSPSTRAYVPLSQRVMPLKVNLAHHALHAFGDGVPQALVGGGGGGGMGGILALAGQG